MKIGLILATLLLGIAPAGAADKWECNGIGVELNRLGVHMFELRLEFDTETRDTKTQLPTPLYFNHAHNGEPIGKFDLRFDKNGTILNGKRCRISCTGGKECE